MNEVVAGVAQQDQVSQHFGRSAGFYRYEIVDGKITSDLYVSAIDHQHDGMVGFLLEQGVVIAVITGGIGAHAVERLVILRVTSTVVQGTSMDMAVDTAIYGGIRGAGLDAF